MRVLLKYGGGNKDAGERSALERPLSSGLMLWSIHTLARHPCWNIYAHVLLISIKLICVFFWFCE